MGFETTLAGFALEHPLMNAAGTCKKLLDVRKLADSPVSAIVVGSITSEPRMGNEGNVYWKHSDSRYSLNALGLPNPGAASYSEHLLEMKQVAERAGKPLIISVAGFSPAEYGNLAAVADRNGADLIELNLGCPNVWQEGGQKQIASFDLEMVKAIWDEVVKRVDTQATVGVKLSPFSNPADLAELAELLEAMSVDFVTTSNTFPNGIAFDGNGKSVIGVGYGGLSGAALKPIALGQVKQLRDLLPAVIDIVGVGGISSAADIHDYLNAGATAVQAATLYWNANENPGVYGDILLDLAEATT